MTDRYFDYFGAMLRDCLPGEGPPIPRSDFPALITDDVRLHVLAGQVTGPAGHVEDEGARGRALVFGRVNGGDAPDQSPWYRCSRHGSP